MNVIGISGRIGAGKDALAADLAAFATGLWPGVPFARVGLADALKDMCIDAGLIPREVAYGDATAKRRRLPNGRTARDVLERIGSAFTDIDGGYWVRVATLDREGIVCVPDVRRIDEVEAIRSRGGVVIRLTRVGEFRHSAVEAELDGYDGFDYVIDNRNLTTQQTRELAVRWLEKNFRAPALTN